MHKTIEGASKSTLVTSGPNPWLDAIGESKSHEFGPKNVKPVNLTSINEIEQIRKTYEPDKIEDLATSITLSHEDGATPEFDMYNPLLCAHLNPEQAQKYLEDHAIFYGTENKHISELAPDNKGNYTILISGHRRKRAIELLAERYNIDEKEVIVHTNARHGITFEEALVAQIRENTYEKVLPEEVAQNIEQFYDYLCQTRPDRKPSYREISALTGLSKNVVATALQFRRLPEEIQKLVSTHRDILPYSTVVKLEPLMRKRAEFYRALTSSGYKLSENVEDYVLNHLHIAAHKIIKAKLKSERAIQFIQAEIKYLEARILHAQPAFELQADTSSTARKKMSQNSLGAQAVGALLVAYGENPDSIPDEQLEKLEMLVEQAKRATEIADLQEGFNF